MVTRLLRVLEYATVHDHWPILFAAVCMIFGVVRFAISKDPMWWGRMQLSSWVIVLQGLCTASRAGFQWSVPRRARIAEFLRVLRP